VLTVAAHGANGRATAGPRAWSQRLQTSRRKLIDELAPLRRPQTAAERAFAQRLNHHREPFFYYPGWAIDRGLVRDAMTTSWGEHLYLVPLTPPTPQQVHRRHGAEARTVRPAEWVLVYGGRFTWAAGSADRVGAGSVGESRWGPGGPASGVERGFALVPDGVSRITYILARQPFGSTYGDPTYARVARLTVPVLGNVAAWQARRSPGDAWIWHAADGRVLKRFGNPAAAAKVVPIKQPGPATALSRAAERNPSTPNPVSITPTTGGAHTLFKLHFGALLNDADYGFRVTGHSCLGYQFAGGFGGPDSPGDLRGDQVDAPLTAFERRALCPGTYHVAVRVSGLEPMGTLRPVGRRIRAKPFGSVTFTVH
jgi:hypothetical protein